MDPVVDLLKALVAIDSVNPSLVPGARGEAEVAKRLHDQPGRHHHRRPWGDAQHGQTQGEQEAGTDQDVAAPMAIDRMAGHWPEQRRGHQCARERCVDHGRGDAQLPGHGRCQNGRQVVRRPPGQCLGDAQ